ncbi:MAG: DUF4264 family protein [Bacillota bacterium]|nr:DUF4264 family protein [Bacillota bacterium]
MKDSLELISSKEFSHYDDMYKVVDFLNKNLAGTNIIVGLSEKGKIQMINIYREN